MRTTTNNAWGVLGFKALDNTSGEDTRKVKATMGDMANDKRGKRAMAMRKDRERMREKKTGNKILNDVKEKTTTGNCSSLFLMSV